MSGTANPTERVAATLAELKQACPGATPEFLLGQLEKSSTVAEAMTSMILAQTESLKTNGEKLAAAEAKAKDAESAAAQPAPRPGHPMPTEGANGKPPVAAGAAGDPVAAWKEAVRAEMAESKCDKRTAVARVARREPQAHTDYLNTFNRAHKRPANFALAEA